MNKEQLKENKEKINDLIYFLVHHNKNYTKKQYEVILELVELLDINK